MNPRMSPRFRLPLHVVTAGGSALLLIFVALVLAWHAYSGTRQVLTATVEEDAMRVSQVLRDKIRGILEPAVGQIELLAHNDIVRARTQAQRLAGVALAQSVFGANALLDAWYVGYPDGSFVLFRRLSSPEMRRVFKAPEHAILLVQTQSVSARGGSSGDFYYFDEQQQMLLHQSRPGYVFDPRTRPWFQLARGNDRPVLTEPYVFFTTREVGTTLAREAYPGGAVIGLDATLDGLAREVDELKITPGSRVAIVDAADQVIALSDRAVPISFDARGEPRLAALTSLEPTPVQVAGRLSRQDLQRSTHADENGDWELMSIPVTLRAEGQTLRVLMAVPHSELFATARTLLQRHLLITLLLILASIPAGYWLTQRLVRPLRALAETTRAVAAFDFSARDLPPSRIAEVDLLATATAQMKSTISRFLDVNVALNSEARLERLLDMVLRDVVNMSEARSAALYLRDETLLRRSQLLSLDGAQAVHPDVLPLAGEHLAAQALRTHASVLGRFAPGTPELVVVPLETLANEAVGVILLELGHPLNVSGAGQRDPLLGLVEALSATAAVAIETRHLIDGQKQLLEALIQLLAGAIDAKSPYTGGHCQRVPELTKMLVRAAQDEREGPLRDFRLSEEEWEAVHVGAWLHDCGKITTPEYVVDKATKLETLYNRIHEVRMRFEVLKRDAEIACLRAIQSGTPEADARATLQRNWQILDEEFAFVAQCNIGGEFMGQDQVARLREIAERRWMRTLDDRLGLSREELRQLGERPAEPLPASEKLLADKPEHLVARGQHELLAADNPWGFKLNVPQYKFNRGELHNLAIGRGTLTDEDRYIINEHIVQTIMMLERLPFPRHLKSVPEIAGGHHERMDGKGYPRRLTREQMSIPARVMAIADVFEALTAADRPYKAPKTLSESLTIMARMVREQHLDGELFALFVRSGVYRRYSEKFLGAAQRDEVDEAALLALATVE